jgi:hypothetical protein
MSNYGQAALTVVGTVVGAYFGYPQLGFALGSLAGSFLFPTQLPTLQGPRLADITSTQASVGAPIPVVWGRAPVPGNIIYQSDVREVVTSDDVGGKGGPSQTVESVTYYQDFAIGLCARPPTRSSAIKGIRRIQANGKWIYDTRPQLSGESADAYAQRVAANAILDEIMTVYLGTDDQLPDPTMEANLGVGNVAAYLDRAYVMFTNWPYKIEDGNRIPASWRFEVFTEGDEDTPTAAEYSNEVLFPWLESGATPPLNPLNDHTFSIWGDGFPGAGGTEATPISSINEGLAIIEGVRGRAMIYYQGAATEETLLGGIEVGKTDHMEGALHPVDVDRPDIIVHYNSVEPDYAYWLDDVTYCQSLLEHGGGVEGKTTLTGVGYTGDVHTDVGNVIFLALPLSAIAAPEGYDGFNEECVSPYGFKWANSYGCAFHVTRVPRAPDDPCSPRVPPVPPRIPGTSDFCVVDGAIRAAGGWSLVTSSWKVLQAYQGTIPVKYPLNPARPSTHPDASNQAFWESAYEDAVAHGDMPAGLTYGVHYPEDQSFGYQRDLIYKVADTIPVSIASILRDNCIESGLVEGTDFDVFDLEEVFVTGYVRTRPMSARAVAESLRPVGFFDVIESGGKLKCVRRGKPTVATLRQSDLGVFENGGETVTRISSTKQLEMTIPRVVRVHYISDDRDLDPDEAPSPVSADTDTVHELDMDIVVVMNSERARQIAEVAWADFRMSSSAHETTVDSSFSRLEPADCAAVPLNGRLERMRILDIDDRVSWVRRLALVRDDDGVPLGAAIGNTVPVIPPVTSILSPTEALFLDLPPLRDEDDNAGFYVAARPYLTGATFRGAQILRSTDGGGNYSRTGGISSVDAIGELVTALAEGPASIWDEGNELVIELQSGTLENRTADDVLTGANAAAIGADGRWEIVQFRDANLVSGSRYRLTGLLRGRRGTEHFIGTSVQGDRFVMISTGQISRLPLDLQLVSRELLYRVVPFGANVDSAVPMPFTGRGVSLKPFSPVDIAGERNEDGDLSITWVRRSRFGESWIDYADVPLSEEREDYEVDVLDGESVVRTLSSSTPSATYTADQQQTDFGSLQAMLSVRIYQISTAVGRGTGGEATV